MDHRHSQRGTCMTANGLPLGNRRFAHMFQGMDLGICSERMLDSMHNQNWEHTLDDILRTDYRNILANTGMHLLHFVRDKWHSSHMDLEHRVVCFRAGALVVGCCIEWMDHPRIPEYKRILVNDLLPYIQRYGRKFPDKDRDIFGWYMLMRTDIQNCWYTLGDNLVVIRRILEDKSMKGSHQQLCTPNSDHMAMDNRDSQVHSGEVPLQIISHRHKYILKRTGIYKFVYHLFDT